VPPTWQGFFFILKNSEVGGWVWQSSKRGHILATMLVKYGDFEPPFSSPPRPPQKENPLFENTQTLFLSSPTKVAILRHQKPKKKEKKRLLGVVCGSSMSERSYLQLKSFICTRALHFLSIIIILRVPFCI
jgi:hypothetical protein